MNRVREAQWGFGTLAVIGWLLGWAAVKHAGGHYYARDAHPIGHSVVMAAAGAAIAAVALIGLLAVAARLLDADRALEARLTFGIAISAALPELLIWSHNDGDRTTCSLFGSCMTMPRDALDHAVVAGALVALAVVAAGVAGIWMSNVSRRRAT